MVKVKEGGEDSRGQGFEGSKVFLSKALIIAKHNLYYFCHIFKSL